MGAQLRPPRSHSTRSRCSPITSIRWPRSWKHSRQRPQVDLPPAHEPALVRRRPADRARRGVDDAVPHAAGRVGRRQGRQVLERARRPRRSSPGSSTARSRWSRSGSTSSRSTSGRRPTRSTGITSPRRSRWSDPGPYTVTKWNPNGTTVMERNRHFWGTNTRSRARADDVLRRQQRRASPPSSRTGWT